MCAFLIIRGPSGSSEPIVFVSILLFIIIIFLLLAPKYLKKSLVINVLIWHIDTTSKWVPHIRTVGGATGQK